ncbi:MAG: hypothetical protein CSB22_00015 [Deltaproteobacteria bacterium]|nr:MAG: hypothetical protein CSB22_00015 [Deltaproteobacteria bacterium]
MAPILSIVGTSGSGKTTLIEKLIPEFKRRGYRLNQMEALISHMMDIVGTEGYKPGDHPKIEVTRADNRHRPIHPVISRLITFVYDTQTDRGVPNLVWRTSAPWRPSSKNVF